MQKIEHEYRMKFDQSTKIATIMYLRAVTNQIGGHLLIVMLTRQKSLIKLWCRWSDLLKYII